MNRKTGQVYKPGAKLKNDYKTDVWLYCAANNLLGIGLQGELEISITYVYPTGHAMDFDAGLKTLGDGIAEAVGFNDKHFKRAHIEVNDRQKGARPHVEVEIRELEFELPLWSKRE